MLNNREDRGTGNAEEKHESAIEFLKVFPAVFFSLSVVVFVKKHKIRQTTTVSEQSKQIIVSQSSL